MYPGVETTCLRRGRSAVGRQLKAEPLGGGVLSPSSHLSDVHPMRIEFTGKRNWWTDAAGWAEDSLASVGGYAAALAVCCLGGLICSVGVWLLASRSDASFAETWHWYLGVALFSTAIPLVYVRASRALVVRRREADDSAA